MKSFKDWSLFSKIYLLVSLMLVVIMALNTFTNLVLSDRIIQNEVRRSSLEAAYSVARDLSSPGALNEPVRITKKFLDFLQINPSISRLDAYERVGNRFRGVASTSLGGPPVLEEPTIEQLFANRLSQNPQTVGGESCLLTLLPVEAEGQVVGAISLLVSLRELGALQSTHLRVALFLTPAAAALLILVTYLVLQRGLQQRLRRIIATMQGVRDGRLDVRILAMGGDELGVIADSFNEMVAAMQKAAEESAQLHVQLDRFNQELQQRVEQASAELQQRYKELQQANEELLSVQMRLSRAERLAVAGQVAATFAHEIGSPLSAISTHLQLLLEDKNLATEVRERVAVVYEQIERIVGIVQQLLATSRPLDMRFEAVDVVECLSQVLGLSRQNLAARRIEVQERIPAGLPKVRGHAQQLQQVFLNLINNAADAMDNGGKLEIEVNVLEGSRPPSLELRFADTGPGIPSSQLTRIFQPFFTTKGTGKGSGLGLAISTEIVRGHGGKLEVSSMEGQGATFLVKLPCLIDEQLN